MNPLSESEAAAVWQVLVDHAGASPVGWHDFLIYATGGTHIADEYRFQGSLGPGGKFRRNRVWIGDTRAESWTVDCYPEDLTADRQAVIDNTNETLAALRKEYAS